MCTLKLHNNCVLFCVACSTFSPSSANSFWAPHPINHTRGVKYQTALQRFVHIAGYRISKCGDEKWDRTIVYDNPSLETLSNIIKKMADDNPSAWALRKSSILYIAMQESVKQNIQLSIDLISTGNMSLIGENTHSDSTLWCGSVSDCICGVLGDILINIRTLTFNTLNGRIDYNL